jgi:hypothetical protein
MSEVRREYLPPDFSAAHVLRKEPDEEDDEEEEEEEEDNEDDDEGYSP